MINGHHVCTVAAENGRDGAMLLEYIVWEHRTAGFWSVSINKREHRDGRAVELGHATSRCGQAGGAQVFGFARSLAGRAVPPELLDDAVSDFLTGERGRPLCGPTKQYARKRKRR